MPMEGLYRNKYKIGSTRLPNYNYSQSGYYFVTICTANRFCHFGNIKNDKMILNENGKIVHQELLKTPQIRKNVILDEFIIMPNHVHAIIIIGEQTGCKDAFNASLPTPYQNKFGSQKNNIASIVRGIKSTTTKQINEKKWPGYFAWQPRFWDHIVRNEKPLNNIRQYIRNNPTKWCDDRNNPDGLLM